MGNTDSHFSSSPLHDALEWWASRDELGGFVSVAASLFPGWIPRRSCRAPHRPDRSPSFSLYRNARGIWKFKDHSTGEQGGLVDFVMLAGVGQADACRWLISSAPRNDEIRMTKLERMTNDPMTKDCARDPFRASGLGLPSDFVIRASSFRAVYQLSDAELRRCAAMATSLAQDPAAAARFASSRGWHPSTLLGLAADGSLGLDGGHLVMLFQTGAKKRFKPFDPVEAANYCGPKFAWMLGKPGMPWRAEMALSSTRRVHITEGESDAISLIDAGAEEDGSVVVAVPGASCWRHEWARLFRGLHVVLWPDPDAAGHGLTVRIAASLAGVAAKVEAADPDPVLSFCQKAH